MSERWKPEEKEQYWTVTLGEVVQSEWQADNADFSRWRRGNCFKTKEEAVAALKKITALLLSLHEPTTNCSQLPKLTVEVFDRPDCPEWAKYAAVTRSGNGIYLSSKSYPDDISGGWPVGQWGFIKDETRIVKWDASDWKNSLIERTTKLPEWCKHNALCYDGKEYLRIVTDGNNSIHAYPVGGGTVKSYEISEITEARLRPYNADEMRGMVGKVIENKNFAHFINAFDKDLQEVVSGADGYSAKDLIEFDYTIDGAPCGVFEHLENGEWVE